jgi:hypothetical protein
MSAVITFQSVAHPVGVCNGIQSGHGINSFQLFSRDLVHHYNPHLDNISNTIQLLWELGIDIGQMKAPPLGRGRTISRYDGSLTNVAQVHDQYRQVSYWCQSGNDREQAEPDLP